MTTTLVPIDANRQHLPAPLAMQQRMAAGQGLSRNFSDGVQDSFPRLSIRGKVFRIRMEGRDEVYKDPQTGHPYAYLDVVFLNASRSLAKTYYTKGFVEGDMNPPDCWSLDSVRPDPSVVTPVNPTCQNCPMNVFGSRITPDGKAAKACADSRRVALSLPHMLTMPESPSFLLRIPQSSLKNLKAYAEGQLARNGYEPGGCVTRLSFDYTAAYPKLQFQFVGPVTEEEYAKVIELANSPFIASMLEAPDFDNAASVGQEGAGMADTGPVAATQRQAPPVTGQQTYTPTQQATPAQAYVPPQQQAPVQHQWTPPQQEPVATQQPVQQQAVYTPPTQRAEPSQPQPAHLSPIRLPTGELLDPMTGQIIVEEQPEEQEPELDPNIIKIADGRFFHRVKGAFVDSPYVDAGPATAVPQQQQAAAAPAAAPKRTRAKKAGEAQPAAQTAPAATPAAQTTQQAAAAANGNQQAAGEPQRQVVAATPALENLLKQMAPQKAN